MRHPQATRAVIQCGEGRGFVVETANRRIVVTAAHCLPQFPPCASFSGPEERTYPQLLGLIGEAPTVWAECLFVDPIGDIALLGTPDNQSLPEQADDCDALFATVGTLSIADGLTVQQYTTKARYGSPTSAKR